MGTFILTYISLEKTSLHSLTHLFHSYNLIHTHIYTSQPLRHTYSMGPTFILTYTSLDKTSFHSLTHLFHSYNLPTHSRLAGSLQPCTFRHANFLFCLLGRKTTGRQGFPALRSPSL